MATAEAVNRLPTGFPEIRCANPNFGPNPGVLVDSVVDGARVVLCRILGETVAGPTASRCSALVAKRAASSFWRSG